MAAFDVNDYYCYDCTYSDAYGRGCKINLMMPVLLLIKGFDHCPKFEKKTTEQIEEQLRIIEQRKNKETKNEATRTIP
jgi:hypothetical protein